MASKARIKLLELFFSALDLMRDYFLAQAEKESVAGKDAVVFIRRLVAHTIANSKFHQSKKKHRYSAAQVEGWLIN